MRLGPLAIAHAKVGRYVKAEELRKVGKVVLRGLGGREEPCILTVGIQIVFHPGAREGEERIAAQLAVVGDLGIGLIEDLGTVVVQTDGAGLGVVECAVSTVKSLVGFAEVIGVTRLGLYDIPLVAVLNVDRLFVEVMMTRGGRQRRDTGHGLAILGVRRSMGHVEVVGCGVSRDGNAKFTRLLGGREHDVLSVNAVVIGIIALRIRRAIPKGNEGRVRTGG